MLQLPTLTVATVVSLDPLPTGAILPHVPILLPLAEVLIAAVAASEEVVPVAHTVAAAVVAVAVLPVADTSEVIVNNMYNS